MSGSLAMTLRWHPAVWFMLLTRVEVGASCPGSAVALGAALAPSPSPFATLTFGSGFGRQYLLRVGPIVPGARVTVETGQVLLSQLWGEGQAGVWGEALLNVPSPLGLA